MRSATASTVVLIGGAPGVGKSTLGAALAARLGVTSLSIDDLMTAAQAVTSPETHPGLHAMRRVPHAEYFTHSSVEKLKSDVDELHAAMWPAVERVIRKHAAIGPGIVIDGYHLRASRVAELALPNVYATWLTISPSVPKAANEATASG